MEDANPYQAPSNHETDSPRASTADLDSLKPVWRRWSRVFALNMIVPLLFGLPMTFGIGWVGMFAAVPVLFALGGCVCACQPNIGRALIRGGVLVALSQLFPVLQIMAGLVAMDLTAVLGQVKATVGRPPEVASVSGGFLMTIFTGLLLMCAALFLGLLIQAILPDRSRNSQPQNG